MNSKGMSSLFSGSKQKGSFAIELAFVLSTMCAILMFATDLSKGLLIRGSLDRTSYALVNVLKERTRYFDGNISSQNNLTVTEDELQDMAKVAARLLNLSSSDDVAIAISSLVSGDVITLSSSKFDSLGCTATDLSSHTDLVAEDDGTVYPLYSVTLCQVHDSWFEAFEGKADTEHTITSSSIVVGR